MFGLQMHHVLNEAHQCPLDRRCRDLLVQQLDPLINVRNGRLKCSARGGLPGVGNAKAHPESMTNDIRNGAQFILYRSGPALCMETKILNDFNQRVLVEMRLSWE